MHFKALPERNTSERPRQTSVWPLYQKDRTISTSKGSVDSPSRDGNYSPSDEAAEDTSSPDWELVIIGVAAEPPSSGVEINPSATKPLFLETRASAEVARTTLHMLQSLQEVP